MANKLPSFNKLAIIKELGSILHRLHEIDLNDNLKHGIVSRHCANLRESLPKGFLGILNTLEQNVDAHLWNNAYEVTLALRGAIPLTYDCVPADTVITIEGVLGVKRKDGFVALSGTTPHPAADTVVVAINH